MRRLFATFPAKTTLQEAGSKLDAAIVKEQQDNKDTSSINQKKPSQTFEAIAVLMHTGVLSTS